MAASTSGGGERVGATRRLQYRWHIFLEPEKATLVDLTFEGRGEATAVRLENSGFDVFGDGAGERQDRVGGAWEDITRLYREAV